MKKSKEEGFFETLFNDLNFTSSQKYIKDELGISI